MGISRGLLEGASGQEVRSRHNSSVYKKRKYQYWYLEFIQYIPFTTAYIFVLAVVHTQQHVTKNSFITHYKTELQSLCSVSWTNTVNIYV